GGMPSSYPDVPPRRHYSDAWHGHTSHEPTVRGRKRRRPPSGDPMGWAATTGRQLSRSVSLRLLENPGTHPVEGLLDLAHFLVKPLVRQVLHEEAALLSELLVLLAPDCLGEGCNQPLPNCRRQARGRDQIGHLLDGAERKHVEALLLEGRNIRVPTQALLRVGSDRNHATRLEIGRASWRERVQSSGADGPCS